MKTKAKTLLYNHIKNLDFHSARESKNPFKWNTPVMNEFIAFGKVLLEDAQQELTDRQKIFDLSRKQLDTALGKEIKAKNRLGQLCTNQRHKIEEFEGHIQEWDAGLAMCQRISNERIARVRELEACLERTEQQHQTTSNMLRLIEADRDKKKACLEKIRQHIDKYPKCLDCKFLVGEYCSLPIVSYSSSDEIACPKDRIILKVLGELKCLLEDQQK